MAAHPEIGCRYAIYDNVITKGREKDYEKI